MQLRQQARATNYTTRLLRRRRQEQLLISVVLTSSAATVGGEGAQQRVADVGEGVAEVSVELLLPAGWVVAGERFDVVGVRQKAGASTSRPDDIGEVAVIPVHPLEAVVTHICQ